MQVITLSDVEAAAERIKGAVRYTPLLHATAQKTNIVPGASLALKLELLQVTGSFKARGAISRLRATSKETLSRGIVAASGGNHGLATAYAGYVASVPTTIFLPANASPAKIEKLRLWGAEVIIHGRFWDEANAAALARVAETGAAYFHPFADPLVVAGQGTIALELVEQVSEIDTLLVAIGGGGLISGLATAFKALSPNTRIIGIEASGSPTLLRSREAGHNVGLDRVTTSVATLACARTDDAIFEMVERYVDEIVLVEDAEMREAAEWLWFEMGLAADLSGAAALAALQQRRISWHEGERICAIVCGAGPDVLG